MARGECFLSPPEGKDGKRHLTVVLTDAGENFMQAVVTVTTLKSSKVQDTSCILRAGDHPFIKHDSVVGFKFAAAMSSIAIFNGLNSGALIRKEAMPAATLERILEAAKTSRRTPPHIKEMLRQAGKMQ